MTYSKILHSFAIITWNGKAVLKTTFVINALWIKIVVIIIIIIVIIIIRFNQLMICMFGAKGYIYAHAQLQGISLPNPKGTQAFSISHYAVWFHI